MSRTTLEACAFGARLGNWSVFIPDPRLGSCVFIDSIKITLKPLRKIWKVFWLFHLARRDQ